MFSPLQTTLSRAETVIWLWTLLTSHPSPITFCLTAHFKQRLSYGWEHCYCFPTLPRSVLFHVDYFILYRLPIPNIDCDIGVSTIFASPLPRSVLFHVDYFILYRLPIPNIDCDIGVSTIFASPLPRSVLFHVDYFILYRLPIPNIDCDMGVNTCASHPAPFRSVSYWLFH